MDNVPGASLTYRVDQGKCVFMDKEGNEIGFVNTNLDTFGYITME